MANIASGMASHAEGEGALATRAGQWAHANGNWAGDTTSSYVPPHATGDAQFSMMALRGTTPGNATYETTMLYFGTNATNRFYGDSGHTYALKLRAVTSCVVSGTRYSRAYELFGVYQQASGVATVTTGSVTSIGDSALSGPTITMEGYPNDVALYFKTLATQAACKIDAKFEFTELIY
jgi:hypothetical protein